MIGFINVYKPRGMTSFQVVAKIKKIFNTKKVGHLGTLDPMAEGVLPIAVGKATKFFDYFLNKDKEYSAVFECGYSTDTLDAFGNILEKNENIPSIEEVEKACQNFIGKIEQIPPKFSAKKINGERAYNLARQGLEFKLKPKEVEIYAIKAKKGEHDCLFNLDIWCSSGTYIRSIGRDVFASINTLATMVKLVRTRAGCFSIDDSYTLEAIQNEPLNALKKIEEVLIDVSLINLNESQYKKIKNGVVINFDGANKDALVVFENNLIGLAEIKDGKMKLKINTLEE